MYSCLVRRGFLGTIDYRRGGCWDCEQKKDDLVKNYKNCHFEIYYILYILARCFLGENCSLLVTAFILYMDVCKADVRFHLTQPLFDW